MGTITMDSKQQRINAGLEAGRQYMRDQMKIRQAIYVADPKKCQYCGEDLPYEKRHNKYCNHSCGASDYNPRGINSRGRARDCVHCGSKTNNKLYCSNDCRHKHKLQEWQDYIDQGVLPFHAPLQRKILRELQGEKCAKCGLTEWFGEKITLVMDHINGNADDNRIVNLRLLCSNCDAQLPTYKSKNRGNGRTLRKRNAPVV